jgi:hypothetical protein
MARFEDAMATLDELRRRASEWGDLASARVWGHMGSWRVEATWRSLATEPRFTLKAEGHRGVFVDHVVLADLSAPLPEILPTLDKMPAHAPATVDESDDFDF